MPEKDEAVVAQAPDKGTPTPEAVEPDAPSKEPDSSEEVDWKQRYEDLRPEADRRASLLADIEGRNGPERQTQALAEHARIELAEEEEAEEPEEEYDLPPDPSDEIAEVKQQLAEEREQREEAEFDNLEQNYIESTVEGLEEAENLKLSEDDYKLVVNYGLFNRDSHDGKPDLEGGFKALKASWENARQRYAESKETFVPPVGTTGEPKINLRDKEARQKLGVEVFEAAERHKEK